MNQFSLPSQQHQQQQQQKQKDINDARIRLPYLKMKIGILLIYSMGIFYFHESEFQQRFIDVINISLLLLQISKLQSGKSLKSIDKFDILITLCTFIARFLIPQLQLIILSFTFYSLKFNLTTILRSIYLMDRIKNISLTMIFIVLLISCIFTYQYYQYPETKTLYGSLGSTSITFLEILTLDSWASRGRILESQVGYTGVPSIIICLYVFILNYFYMNILIGLILESLQVELNQLDHQKKNNHTRLESLIIGKIYHKIILTLTPLTVLFNLTNNFQGTESHFEMYFNQIVAFLYTLHFISLFYLQGERYQYETQRIERILLHFIAGPLSLLLYDTFGCFCIIIKLATTPLVRGVISGTINLFKTLIPGIFLLLGLILFMSSIMFTQYHEFIGLKGEPYYTTFQQAVYTFIQILTLDDWNANVLPVFENKDIILPYLLFPVFIIVSNFIFLNILIALSCKYFNEVDYSIIEMSTRAVGQQSSYRLLLSHIKMPKCSPNNAPNTYSEQLISQRQGVVQLILGNRSVHCVIQLI